MKITNRNIIVAIVLLIAAMLIAGCASKTDVMQSNSPSDSSASSTSGITGQAVSQSDLSDQVDSGFQDETSEMEIGDMI